jgi:hypothetical protein
VGRDEFVDQRLAERILWAARAAIGANRATRGLSAATGLSTRGAELSTAADRTTRGD